MCAWLAGSSDDHGSTLVDNGLPLTKILGVRGDEISDEIFDGRYVVSELSSIDW